MGFKERCHCISGLCSNGQIFPFLDPPSENDDSRNLKGVWIIITKDVQRLNSAPYGRCRIQPTSLQFYGLLVRIGSTMTFEKRFRSGLQGQVQPFQPEFNLLGFQPIPLLLP